jgi:PAS domain S-box-containing protein
VIEAAPHAATDLYREIAIGLAQQGTLIGVSVLAYAWVLTRASRSGDRWLPTLLLIVLTGVTMFLPFNFGRIGGQFDMRRVPITFAALDVPLPHGLLVTASAIAFRLTIGGPKAMAGVGNIVLSFAVALLFAYAVRRGWLKRNLIGYALLGMTAGPTYALAQLLSSPPHTLPEMLADGTLVSVILFNTAATCFFGLVTNYALDQECRDRALADSAIAMQRILQSSAQGILLHDGLKPIFANETFAHIYGFDSAQALVDLGTIKPLLISRTGNDITDQVLWDVSPPDGQARFERDVPARRADGASIWVDLELRRTIWNGKEVLQAIAVDVTEAHRANELLQSRRAMLERHQSALLSLLRVQMDGSLSPEQVAAAVLPLAAQGMNCDRVGLWQIDVAARTCDRVAFLETGHAIQFEPASYDFDRIPAAWIETTSSAAVINDTAQVPLPNGLHVLSERARSLLLVRFPVDARHSGSLAFIGFAPREWLLEEQIFARAVANIVGLAMLSALRQKNFASLDAVVDAILVVDRGGRVTFANRSAYDQIGLSQDDVIDEHAMSLLPDLPPRSEQESSHVVQWTRLDGSKALVRVLRNSLADGGSIASWRDVTAEIESKSEREMLRSQLAQAAKMEAVGRLAGGIAHDFNNMLGAIIGFAGFLADDLESNAELQSYARKILTVSDRAKQLVAQILAFSHGRDMAMASVDLRDVAQEARELLRGLLPSTTAIDLAITAAPATILGNAVQLQQVMVNLCVNARDALPDGDGRIGLSIELVRSDSTSPLEAGGGERPGCDARLVHGSLDLEQPYVRLRIEDNGTGMSQTVLDRIFEPFFTSKERGRGTGLGLAVVHGLLVGHQASYAVSSNIGRGTVFDIFLPFAAATARDAATQRTTKRPAVRSLSLLLVDDEPDLLDAMAIGLRRLGLEVAATTQPQQAVAWVAEQPGRFDVMVTDQVMPGLRGTALIAMVKRADPQLRVILTTGYSDGATEEGALAAGADAFILKPVPPETVARAAQVVVG